MLEATRDMAVKAVLDVDYEIKLDADKDEAIAKVRKDIYKLMADGVYKKVLGSKAKAKEGVRFFQCHRPVKNGTMFKISFRVICRDVAFENIQTSGIFIQYLKPSFEDCHLDMSIYSRDRFLRLPGSWKSNEESAEFEMVPDQVVSSVAADEFATAMFIGEDVGIKVWTLEMLEEKLQAKFQRYLKRNVPTLRRAALAPVEPGPANVLNVLACQALAIFYGVPEMRFSYQVKDDGFMYLDAVDDITCVVNKARIHSTHQGSIVVNLVDLSGYIKCFGEDCGLRPLFRGHGS